MFVIIDLALSQFLEFIRKGVSYLLFSKERKKCCWLKGAR